MLKKYTLLYLITLTLILAGCATKEEHPVAVSFDTSLYTQTEITYNSKLKSLQNIQDIQFYILDNNTYYSDPANFPEELREIYTEEEIAKAYKNLNIEYSNAQQ